MWIFFAHLDNKSLATPPPYQSRVFSISFAASSGLGTQYVLLKEGMRVSYRIEVGGPGSDEFSKARTHQAYSHKACNATGKNFFHRINNENG